jgi:hypothetical protein
MNNRQSTSVLEKLRKLGIDVAEVILFLGVSVRGRGAAAEGGDDRGAQPEHLRVWWHAVGTLNDWKSDRTILVVYTWGAFSDAGRRVRFGHARDLGHDRKVAPSSYVRANQTNGGEVRFFKNSVLIAKDMDNYQW